MLKQESSLQEKPAALMRVKKEEFARAIAALEERRQAEAQELEGTVVIGDVLQQLQITTPAEDVLHEIEAFQAGQPYEDSDHHSTWSAEQKTNAKLVAGIVLVPLAIITMAVLILNPLKQPPPANMPSSPMVAAPGDYARLWASPLPNLPPGATAEAMDEGAFNASSILKPLSVIADNEPVHCTTASLTQLLMSSRESRWPRLNDYHEVLDAPDPSALAKSKQLFDVRPNLHKPWALIKHDNRLYLRGWVAAKFTEEQSHGHFIVLHSSAHSFDLGIQPQQITLVTSFTQYSSSGTDTNSSQSEIVAMDVTLDNHAWEKW